MLQSSRRMMKWFKKGKIHASQRLGMDVDKPITFYENYSCLNFQQGDVAIQMRAMNDSENLHMWIYYQNKEAMVYTIYSDDSYRVSYIHCNMPKE